MTRILAALALACALATSACVPRDGTGPGTSAEGWRQIAIGVGAVVGETSIDPRIERVSARLAEHCATVQTAALAIDLFAPARVRSAAENARIVVATFCAAPPRNVAQALASLAAAYAAIDAARRQPAL